MRRINRLCLLTPTPARCRRAADLLAWFGRRSGNRALVELAHAMVELAHAMRYSRIGDHKAARVHADRHMCLCRRAAEGGV